MLPTPSVSTEPPAVRCPKCATLRTGLETVPEWQCPACGIAYEKCAARLAERQAASAARPAGAVPSPGADGSVWALLLVNAATLVVALLDRWDAVALMAAYCAQSVTIGVSNVFRILGLDRFSTEGLKVNNRPVDPTAATKRRIGGFFAVHYGVFHAGYFVFLLIEAKRAVIFDGWFRACAIAFALNHWWSYRYNHELDRQGLPNIGTLMFTPYLRIMPMHATIVLGALFIRTGAGLLFFGT